MKVVYQKLSYVECIASGSAYFDWAEFVMLSEEHEFMNIANDSF